MIRKLIPVLLGLAGLGIGAGAGFVLHKPATPKDPAGAEAGHDAAQEASDGHAPASPEHEASDDHAAEGDDAAPEFVQLANQFVIPVVEDGRVAALVVLSLNLEVQPGASDAVFAREPKLRDGFLQVLLEHANAGGFRGAFTDAANMVILRRALGEVAAKVAGDLVKNVLILDIVRQDS